MLMMIFCSKRLVTPSALRGLARSAAKTDNPIVCNSGNLRRSSTTKLKMLNGVKRIRAPLTKPVIHPINDYRCLLKECQNDYLARVPFIENKINVVEANLHIVPFLADGLAFAKNELIEVHNRINQINNVLENDRLNIPVQ